jgi:hypothetical protein
MKLRIADNLKAETLELGEPWEFNIQDGEPFYEKLKTLDKERRRGLLLQESCKWQVYSAYEGHGAGLRVRRDNPAKQMLALVADYDRKYDVDAVLRALEDLKKSVKGGERLVLLPNYIEISLSGNVRLIWLFERPINLPSAEFHDDFVNLLTERLHVTEILLGYDENSKKPEQLWTNGGTWADLEQPPLSFKWLLGICVELLKKEKYEGKRTVPLEVVAARVEELYPGEWVGEFKLDATGKRFWDEKADNPSGCQVKLDGMVCFTGPYSFRSWTDIFGADWVKVNTELNEGALIEPYYYNQTDQTFHVLENGIWQVRDKESVARCLRVAGASGKVPKGETASQVDTLITSVERTKFVFGVAPFVNHPYGKIMYKGKPWINTAEIHCVKGVKGETGTPADFPEIWARLQAFTGKDALDTFLTWHRRFWRSQRDYDNEMGQAIFLCGKANTGKTLILTHLVTASVGGVASNPYDYFTGKTQFNAQLFASPVLMVNDEESPETQRERRALHAKIKSSVVNPTQMVHQKFRTPTMTEWCGRVLWSLNDDPGDTIQLPEIVPSNADKIMFFRLVDTGKPWPSRKETETTFARELPAYLWWLDNVYEPPKHLLEGPLARLGVQSYFDPLMRKYSLQNTDAYAVLELLREWIKNDSFFFDDSGKPTQEDVWTGTSSELLTMMHAHDILKPLLQGVTAKNLPKSLESLSKQKFSGVTIDPDRRRHFIIDRHIYNDEE